MSEYLVWFLIGVVFLVLEFTLPTFVLFFFAVGAFLVSIITAFIDLSINWQIIYFSIFSVTSLLLLRSYFKSIFTGFQSKGKDHYFDSAINSEGDIAIITKTINPNLFGEIKYKGSFYKAQSSSTINEGKQVKVIKKGDEQESFFIVEEIEEKEI